MKKKDNISLISPYLLLNLLKIILFYKYSILHINNFYIFNLVKIRDIFYMEIDKI
jgi:hypothetical protein